MKLFIESSSLAPDYHNYNTETNYMKIGGYWSNSSQGGIFSTHWQNEYYQESYQSWEIVDYEVNHWPSSRRCGYIFYSNYYSIPGIWHWYVAGTDGKYDYDLNGAHGQQCNCPQKYGPYTAAYTEYSNVYTAVCQSKPWITADGYSKSWNNSASVAWVRSNTCPKGWGKYYDDPASKSGPYVKNAQGYVVDGDSEPVYGYVTRYRDAWYDFYSTRVAKI